MEPTVERQYSYIQGLRFFSAAMVVLCHSTFYVKERLNPETWFYNLGANGVSLFFVISGFVIMLSGERLLANGASWQLFALKRVERIVPLYWIYTTLKLLVMALTVHLVLHARMDLGYIVKSYLFIPAINIDGQAEPILGVGWTLIFEMAFYALLALALFVKRDPLWIVAPPIILFFILSFFKLRLPVEISFFANPLIIEFLYGVIIAKWAGKLDGLPRPLALAGAGLGLLFLFVPRMGLFETLSQSPIGFGLASAVTIASLVCLERKANLGAPKWLVFLGAASYSLYLVHPLIAPLVPELMHKLRMANQWIAICMCLLVALGASIGSYLFLEKPIGRALTRLTKVAPTSIGRSR